MDASDTSQPLSHPAFPRIAVIDLFGAFLAFTIVLTSIHWLLRDVAVMLANGRDAMCWPFWEACWEGRILDASQWRLLFWVLGGLGVVTGAGFLSPRTRRWATLSLVVLTVIKLVIIGFDYRLRLNQHIMSTWATAVYLLPRGREPAIKLLIIMFYFYAGVIKFTPEWLSGAALYGKPWLVPEALIPVSLYYVVVLEVALVWALLWERSKLAWLVLAQLIIFHITSFTVVGFFYPMIMFSLLAIFPLSWVLEPQTPRLLDLLKNPGSAGQKAIGPALAVSLLFSGLQFYTYAMPGVSALTGEGRLFTLHMFDAMPVCKASETLHFTNGKKRRQKLRFRLPPRIRCDPVVFLTHARRSCHQMSGKKGFRDLDLFVESRLKTGKKMHTLIDIPNFCSSNIQYSMWSHNDWIQTSED